MPELRLSEPEDEPALLALTRACPMAADISLQIEREPDFFALSNARGDTKTVVAEVSGEIVGCVSASRRPAWLQGSAGEIGVISDLKVHPDHRGGGLGQRLLDEVARLEATGDPAPFVAQTAAGNSAVDTVVHRFGEGRTLEVVGEFTSYQLLPVRPLPAPTVEVHEATQADLPELVALLDGFHARLDLSPISGEGAFDRCMQRSPGLSLSDYLLARRGGRIVAAVARWDQHTFKRTRVMAMPTHLRWLCASINAANRFLPLCRMPAPGAPLTFRYLRQACHVPDELEALRQLVRVAVNEARARGDHFALFTTATGDPLSALASGIPRTTYRYRLVAGANRPEADAMVHRLRGRALYDDASLA